MSSAARRGPVSASRGVSGMAGGQADTPSTHPAKATVFLAR